MAPNGTCVISQRTQGANGDGRCLDNLVVLRQMLLWYYHENSANMVYRIELSNSFKLSELTRAMLAIYEENLLVEQKSWNSRRRHRTLSIKYLFYFFLTRILFKNQRGSFQVTFYNCLFLVFGSVEDPYDCFVLFFIYLTFQVTSLQDEKQIFSSTLISAS